MGSSSGTSLIMSAPKIAGGIEATKNEFPFQVSITYGDKYVCGGSILNTFIILTAAHCLWNRNRTLFRITAGQHDFSNPDPFTEQVRAAKYFYSHDNYNHSTKENDIALVVLNETLAYTPFVQNISLPAHQENFQGNLVTVGWGAKTYGGNFSSVLRKIRLRMIPNDQCAHRYMKVKMISTNNVLCAGEKGKDACDGDGGGGGICKKNNKKMVCGVVSTGIGCGETYFPGLWTRVASYVPWIHQTQEIVLNRRKCKTDHIFCSGECKPRSLLCDLEKCKTSDMEETLCSQNCSSNDFRCNNGKCILKRYRCDMEDDCGDMSDEEKCRNKNTPCATGEHQCGSGGRCIPDSWRCDNHFDCDDDSDEVSCTNHEVSACGPSDPVLRERIVGGYPALPGEFPFQIVMNGYGCGGSILSPSLVLTAAHCLKGADLKILQVTAGLHHEDEPGNCQTRTVKRMYLHEDFNGKTMDNDIALIELSEPLEFTNTVSSISLPRPMQEFIGCVDTIGFGTTQAREFSDSLRKTSLPIVPNDQCQKQYASMNKTITPEMLCAGAEGRDACRGDSGGAAVCQINNVKILCGVVSFGNGCARAGYAGVFVKVARYVPWIDSVRNKIQYAPLQWAISLGKCRTDHFYCSKTDECLPRSVLCNSAAACSVETIPPWEVPHCAQHLNCTEGSEFRCDNGKCIPEDDLCDNRDDCGDGSDEQKCPIKRKDCEATEHQCGPNGRCIPNLWKCDGQTDCDDGSDEADCPQGKLRIALTLSPCESHLFACRNGACIDDGFVCDGEKDCVDGSDEEDCPNGFTMVLG